MQVTGVSRVLRPTFMGSYSNRQGRCMRFGIVTLLFALFVKIKPGQGNSGSAPKLPSFETLARKSETKVIWSMEVGHLTGGESHAIFTTLIVEDSMPEYPRARGCPGG